jgi:hypothetical protein
VGRYPEIRERRRDATLKSQVEALFVENPCGPIIALVKSETVQIRQGRGSACVIAPSKSAMLPACISAMARMSGGPEAIANVRYDARRPQHE